MGKKTSLIFVRKTPSPREIPKTMKGNLKGNQNVKPISQGILMSQTGNPRDFEGNFHRTFEGKKIQGKQFRGTYAPAPPPEARLSYLRNPNNQTFPKTKAATPNPSFSMNSCSVARSTLCKCHTKTEQGFGNSAGQNLVRSGCDPVKVL